MADIDGLILDHEFGIGLLLVGQLLLAASTGALGYLAGLRGRPRWARVGFLLPLLLAVAAGGRTRYLCAEARTSIQGRLDGRIPGQFVSEARGQNHLAFVWGSGLACGTILAATILGSGLLHYLARRRCENVSSL